MVNFVKSALNMFGISNKDDEAVAHQGVNNLDEFLTGFPGALGYDVEFKRTQLDDGSHHIEILGEDRLSFLGENTQLLDAIAHISMRVLRKQEGLANKAVEEGTELSRYRVTVDAEGFREKHYENLKQTAEAAREKVLANAGRPAYIPALSPAERRIIHTHLATLGEVTSESIGNGTFKRIRVKLINAPKSAGPRAEGDARPPRQGGEGRGFGGGGGGGRGGRGGRGGQGRNNRPAGPGGGGNGFRAGGGFRSNGANNSGGEIRKARFDDYQQPNHDPNGNVAAPVQVEEDDADDNIGNR